MEVKNICHRFRDKLWRKLKFFEEVVESLEDLEWVFGMASVADIFVEYFFVNLDAIESAMNVGVNEGVGDLA